MTPVLVRFSCPLGCGRTLDTVSTAIVTHECAAVKPGAKKVRPAGGGVMLAADDPRHGTAHAYVNLACRCLACRKAHTELRNRRRRERWAETAANGGIAPGPRKHGVCATYNNWGCQCEPCRAASRAVNLIHVRNYWARKLGGA